MNRIATLSLVSALITISASTPLSAQTGTVFLNGNSCADNGGTFLGLGVTYMSALYWAKNDRTLLDGDLAYLASKEFKYIRILSEVPGGCGDFWNNRGIHPVNYTSSGGCFQPAWTDYTAQLQYLLDRTYDTFGMRTEITIFGGAGGSMPAKSTRIQHLDRVLNAIVGREHKVMMLEVANEGWQTGFEGSQGQADMREFAAYLAARTNILVAITSPQDTSNAGIVSVYGASAADIATVHFSRDIGPDGGWVPVYDCYRTSLSGVPPMSSNEPIGPGSSVAPENDPIKLVMAAAFAWGANLPMYVYHTNAGVRRDVTFQSMAASDAYVYLNDQLPSDFVNWTRHDGKETASPFTNYANGVANRWWPEVGGTNGAVRNTGKNNGSQFITLPIGILSGGLQVQARRPVSFNAYNPLNNTAAFGATLNTNAFATIPQGPRGYIIKGIFPDLVSVVTVDLDSVDIERGIDHIVCCDGNTSPASIGGRNARTNNTVPDHYFYFNVSDGYTFQGNKPNQTLVIDYFDKGTGTITLEYDATSSSYKSGQTVQLVNSNTWKQVTWQVTDAYFGNRENGGSDFRLACFGGVDFYIDSVQATVTTVQQTPFGGTARAIPGIIQAEDFDNGGQGVAYNDGDAGNNGGQYRSTDVDVELTSDTGGGYNVGWTSAGEWLEYTVNVNTTGDYAIKMRVASSPGGSAFHVEMNGQNLTGTRSFASTGGWQNWTTIIVPGILLTAGNNQILRIVMDAGDFNLNHIEFVFGGDDVVSVDLSTSNVNDGMSHLQGGDGDTVAATIGGHNCRRNSNPADDFYYYFEMADIYTFQGNFPVADITIDYYDTGTATLTLDYDALSSPFKQGPSVSLTNTNTWKQFTFHVTDAYFGNRENGGADFRIASFGGTFYIDTVMVHTSPGTGGPTTLLNSPFTSSTESWNIVVWRAGQYSDGFMAHDTTTGNPAGSMRSAGSGGSNNTDSCTREGGEINRAVSTSGFSTIQVQYDLRFNTNQTGPTCIGSCPVLQGDCADKLAVYYSTAGTGGPWTFLEQVYASSVAQGSFTTRTLNLPAAAGNKPNFALRFRFQFNQDTDIARVDNIKVIGTP